MFRVCLYFCGVPLAEYRLIVCREDISPQLLLVLYMSLLPQAVQLFFSIPIRRMTEPVEQHIPTFFFSVVASVQNECGTAVLS